MVADRQARRGGASDPVSQGRPRSEERGMSFVKTFALAGSAVALLATGAIAHQAQPAPQVQPQTRPQILPDPAASPLPAQLGRAHVRTPAPHTPPVSRLLP